MNDTGATEPLLKTCPNSSITNVAYDCITEEFVGRYESEKVKMKFARRAVYLSTVDGVECIFFRNILTSTSICPSIFPTRGSIRGSVFNLASATLGAGALSLPYAVAVSGLGFAVAQLILAAFLTVYSIRLLVRAEDITKYEL
ncbi:hypothetical protein PsorP6_004886 [Peronosclerospora sorghi]|uniref:Uncharacterized protein n=1 Tax=Peronosclerospora sorghi TaxID=230839 RepID=A0ACC0W6E0_9STRA|nr:hypothetical protein PsorP6_004886 [Peronosclerospora sorghi]